MNSREFRILAQQLKIRGLKIPRLLTLNMVRHHNSGETPKHLLSKTVGSKILLNAQHPHLTEFEFPNGVVADIFDLKDFLAIEFESINTPRSEALKLTKYTELVRGNFVRDVIIIDISKLPANWIGIERALRKRLGL